MSNRGCWGGAACCHLLPRPFGFGMLLRDRFPHFIPPGMCLEIMLELEGFPASSSSLRVLREQQVHFPLCPGSYSCGNHGFAPAGAIPEAGREEILARSCHLLSACPDPHIGGSWNGCSRNGIAEGGIESIWVKR